MTDLARIEAVVPQAIQSGADRARAGKVKLRDGTKVVTIVSGGNMDPGRVVALF